MENAKKFLLDILGVADELEERGVSCHKNLRNDVNYILRELNKELFYARILEIKKEVTDLFLYSDALIEERHEDLSVDLKKYIDKVLNELQKIEQNKKKSIKVKTFESIKTFFENFNNFQKKINELDFDIDFYTEDLHIGFNAYKSNLGNIKLRYNIFLRDLKNKKSIEITQKNVEKINIDEILQKVKTII